MKYNQSVFEGRGSNINIEAHHAVTKYPHVALKVASHMKRAVSIGIKPSSLTNTVEGLLKLDSKFMGLKKLQKKVEFEYKGKRLLFNFETKEDIRYTLYEIYEQFYEEQYGLVDPKGKRIMDIGAGYADTPIYFAINGARSVIAYEPGKQRYKIGLMNIRSNHLQNKIKLQNSAVGSLSDLASADVLKIDCEGCEYGLLQQEKELSRFNEVILEYHNGYLDLKRHLKSAGFKTRNLFSPYYNVKERRIMETGILYAFK